MKAKPFNPQEGLIKALFATETFAMGLNMPAGPPPAPRRPAPWDGSQGSRGSGQSCAEAPGEWKPAPVSSRNPTPLPPGGQARTVIFTKVRKWDGEGFRWLESGEYVQMSGRAGRRGTDAQGYCLVMADEELDGEVARAMMLGKTKNLDSRRASGREMQPGPFQPLKP